jgi:hypothetical protein
VHENIKRLLWSQNHPLISTGRLAANKPHEVCFLRSGNQPVALPVLVDQTHHSSYLVERRIRQILHPLLAEFMQAWKNTTSFSQPGDWVFASFKCKWKQPRVANMLVESHLRPAAVKAGVLVEGEGALRVP